MRQLVYEKETSEFKAVKLRLKFDLVKYPARAEGLGKYVLEEIMEIRIDTKSQKKNETRNDLIKSLKND